MANSIATGYCPSTDDRDACEGEEFRWNDAALTECGEMLWPIVERWLARRRPRDLLDLGCGNGSLTNRIAELGVRVVGLDSSASGLEQAQRAYPELDVRLQDLTNPLPAELRGKFDAVLSAEVVEHLFQPRVLPRRAKEALRPEGELLITTPYHGYFKNLAIALLNGFDRHWHPLRDLGHIKFFSARTLGLLLSDAGFDIVQVRRVGRIPPLAKSIVMIGRKGRVRTRQR